MKKTIVILIAILISTALSACGDTDTPADTPANGTNNWWGYYEARIFDEYVYVHINNFDGESFRFEIYGENIEEFAGVAAVWPDAPNKAEYMGITFTYDTDEITVEGSDYGIMDGTYTRYVGDAGGDFDDPVG